MITKHELLLKIESLQRSNANNLKSSSDYITSLAERLSKLIDQLDARDDRIAELEEKLADHEEKLAHVNEYVKELFDDAVAETAKEWNKGLEEVINFNPYGVK